MDAREFPPVVHNVQQCPLSNCLPDVGQTVLVVMSLNENTFYDHSYVIGFPGGGHWDEVFNSDVYDHGFDPQAQGTYEGIEAGGPADDGLPCSAGITLPANSVLIFAWS